MIYIQLYYTILSSFESGGEINAYLASPQNLRLHLEKTENTNCNQCMKIKNNIFYKI